MNTREEVLEYGLTFPGAYRDAPFHDANWQLLRYSQAGIAVSEIPEGAGQDDPGENETGVSFPKSSSDKAFLWTYERNGYVNINVKTDPEWRDLWRQTYASVLPAYHQNKEHWNTVILDGSVPDDVIRRMIAESYDLISDSPTKRIYEAVRKIPAGHVATYGQVAELAGEKKMARAVGNALHKNPDPEHIPCFRVVNSKGELAGEFAFGGKGEQAKRLRADGVESKDGCVDLEKYGIRLIRDPYTGECSIE